MRYVIVVLVCLLVFSFFSLLVRCENTNLAPMIVNWGGYIANGGVVKYGDDPQLCFVDANVKHNGHWSIRINGITEPWATNKGREVNEKWITTHPGSRVYISCWVKTGDLPYSELPDGEGAILGFDFYGGYGRISECHPRTIQSENWRVDANNVGLAGDKMEGATIYVPYGSDWTLLTLDVIIPATFFAGETGGALFPEPVQIDGIIPWVGGSHNPANRNENAPIWFADCELYVDPESIPTSAPAQTQSITRATGEDLSDAVVPLGMLFILLAIMGILKTYGKFRKGNSSNHV